jgi:beta-glucuronidase
MKMRKYKISVLMSAVLFTVSYAYSEESINVSSEAIKHETSVNADSVAVVANETKPVSSAGFVLFDSGTEKIPDYEKYGVFHNVGTRQYYYEIKDEEGLAAAVGEGVYPNGLSIYKDPEYQRFKKEGKLDKSHWDYVNIDDCQASFYRWALAEEEPGVAQFYTAMALEKAGLLENAVKAYYACLVNFPNSTGWTYFQTPWYLGKVAVDKIMYITRNHPELGMKLVGADVVVEGGFDNNPYNDVVITNPGKLIACKKEETAPQKTQVDGLKIIERRGQPPSELVKYENGHWQLLVDGKPYIAKTMSYFPVTIGQSPDEGNLADWMNQDTNGNGKPDAPYDAWVDKNFNNIQDPDEPSVGDFALFKEMGVNTLRLYHHSSNKELLRDLYKTYGIRVIMGDFLGMYCTGSGAKWEDGTDYTNKEQQKNMIEGVKQMIMEYKDEPYIIMWILGNENNYGGTFGHVGGSGNAGQYPDAYYGFVNEVAKFIKTIDPVHPVGICNGDTLFMDILSKYAPDIDVFGTNSYRGAYGFEHSIWNDIKTIYDKPVIITEYGCPLYIEGKTKEYQEQKQAEYLRGNWEGILYNSCGYGVGNAIGGVVFEWVDGWWKSGQPPRFSSWMHEVKGNWMGPFPGNWSYEEWFGLAGQGDGTKSPLMRQLRKSFYEYKDIWNK